MTCKHCTAPIASEEIMDGDAVAVCQFCGTVHYLSDKQVNLPTQNRQKAKRSIPDKFNFEQIADGYKLDYRWLGKQHTGLLFFAILWNGFVCFMTIAIGGAALGGDGEAAGGIWFMSIFIIVGLFMAYYVLVGFLNHTTILIRRDGLDIQHAPLPWISGSGGRVDRRAIEQVYCVRRVAYESNDVPVYVFDVHYVAKGGDDVALVKGLDTLHKAIFIEQQIEQKFKIDDQRVSGEYDGAY